MKYLRVNGTQGYAIVDGSPTYEVEFSYQNGEMADLTCSCYCSGPCKHEVALLLLPETLLTAVEEQYPHITKSWITSPPLKRTSCLPSP